MISLIFAILLNQIGSRVRVDPGGCGWFRLGPGRCGLVRSGAGVCERVPVGMGLWGRVRVGTGESRQVAIIFLNIVKIL